MKNRNTYNIFTIKQKNINEIVENFDKNLLTKYDKRTMERIYKNMIFFGSFIYPEASKILKHYIFGNGEDLIIESEYFYNSKVIKNVLDNKKNEILGPIKLNINDDPRIAYAINGFYIKNINQIEIYQEIKFAERNDKDIYTFFDILGNKLKIPDRLIRIFEENGGCKTFTVRIINRD
jgi:hypothetical protein